MSRLRTQPLFRPFLIPAAIQYNDGRAGISHLNVKHQVGELFINGTARLLPFGLNDQVIRPELRMINDKVAVLRRFVDTWSYMKTACEDRLLQNTAWREPMGIDVGISPLAEAGQDEAFQDGSGVVGLRTAWNTITAPAGSS